MSAPPHELVDRVDHLSVHVQLKLAFGRVPHPHRARPGKTGEVVQLDLLQIGAAVDVVEDLQLGPGDTGGVDQPREEGFRLGWKAEVQQCLQRK